jgi:phosphonate transport system substrate-binding protein
MPTLRFANFLAPNMQPVYQFIADYIGDKLSIQTEVFIGESPSQFANGEADIGFICSPPYIRLRAQTPSPVELLAAPVLQGARYDGKPIYFSDIIVHCDSTFHTFEDLRGGSWAYNEPESLSGYFITLHKLMTMGETAHFFGRTVQAGFHQKAIRMVAQREIDAAAIDSQVLAIELRDHPELAADICVIDMLGPNPIQPVLAASRLPESLKADVKSVLLTLGDDSDARAMLNKGCIERFVEVQSRDYDVVQRMIERLFAAGVTNL